MATHSGVLARKIPWTEGPGGLQSTGQGRVWLKPNTHIISRQEPGWGCGWGRLALARTAKVSEGILVSDSRNSDSRSSSVMEGLLQGPGEVTSLPLSLGFPIGKTKHLYQEISHLHSQL